MNGQERKEFTNLTFQELENFVYEWIQRTPDVQAQFYNQAHDINKLLRSVGNHDEKCRNLNVKFNFVNYLDSIIQTCLHCVQADLEWLEKCVTTLEYCENYCPCKYRPSERFKLYCTAIKINKELNELQESLDDLTLRTNSRARLEYKDIPTAFITQILHTQLQSLESAESKIFKMKDTLQVIDCKWQMLRNKLKKVV